MDEVVEYSDVTAQELREMALSFVVTSRDIAIHMAATKVQGAEPLADYMGFITAKLVQLAYMLDDNFKLTGEQVKERVNRAAEVVEAHMRNTEVETLYGGEVPPGAAVH